MLLLVVFLALASSVLRNFGSRFPSDKVYFGSEIALVWGLARVLIMGQIGAFACGRAFLRCVFRTLYFS